MFLFPIMLTNLYKVNDKPPTIYSLLQSIVNFDREEQVKIKDLALYGHSTIFDFNYPLSSKVNKDEFETLILNKFMMRRIGYETLTAFQIALNVKLNEIMPVYNKLFDAMDGWDLFSDTDETTRTKTFSGSSTGTNNLTSNVTSSNTAVSDRRNSELPQNELENIQDGNYMTDYNYDTDTNSGTSTTASNGTNNNTDNSTENENVIKNKHSATESINIYKQFLENKQNIYSMIFKELEDLFYQIV